MLDFIKNLTTKQLIFTIVILGVVTYFNGLFNGFVWDDGFQIVTNLHVQNSEYFYYFSHTIGPYYKPLMFFVYVLIFKIFGLNSFFFHFVQLSLFILNGMFVYFLLHSLLKNKVLSVLAAFLFIIHPINQEVAIYIADFQDVLFAFFGLSALLVLIRQPLRRYNNLIGGVFLLLGLFSKETGVLFVIVYLLHIILFKKTDRLLRLIVPIVALGTYLLIRLAAVGLISPTNFNFVPQNSLITLPFANRLLSIPKIILFYLKTLVFPLDLTPQYWYVKAITFSDFVIPLVFDTLVLGLLVFVGALIYKKNRAYFITFLYFFLWFSLGIGFHLQIIPLEKTAADRWFYFPLIGLLGMILTLVVSLGKALTSKLANNKWLWFFILAAFLALTARTIVRNANYYSNMTLFSHDISYLENVPDAQDNYGLAFMGENRFKEAIVHFQEADRLLPNNYLILFDLGKAYLKNHQLDSANITFRKVIELKSDYSLAYNGLTISLLLQDNYKEAMSIAETATRLWPDDPYFWNLLGLSAYKLNDYNTAKSAIQKSLSIYPDPTMQKYLDLMDQRQPIYLNLGSQ